MLDPKVHINLQDFYCDLISDGNQLLYIWDYDTCDFLFQGVPLEDKEEWKELLSRYKYCRVSGIDWGITFDKRGYLNINIHSTIM